MGRPEPDRMYSLKEIEDLGLLPFRGRTLRLLAARGRLTAQNVGAGERKRRWRVRGSDITKFREEMREVAERGRETA